MHIASGECKLSPQELVPVQGVLTTRVVVTPLDGATWLVEVTQQSVLIGHLLEVAGAGA